MANPRNNKRNSLKDLRRQNYLKKQLKRNSTKADRWPVMKKQKKIPENISNAVIKEEPEKYKFNILSNQDKIAFLKSTKKGFTDINTVAKYMDFLDDPLLRKSLLAKIMDFMVGIDVDIASEYDMLSDEEWHGIESAYPTPISDDRNKTLREQIQVFTSIFLKLDSFFKNVMLSNTFEIFEKYVFTSKTRYMQFLVYNCSPESVLVYFLSSLKNNHVLSNHYVGCLSSFLVRRKMDENIVKKAMSCFFKYISSLTNRYLYLNATQYFLYVLCFKKIYFDTYKDFVESVLEKDALYLNRNIVAVFCNVYQIKCVQYFIENSISKIEYFYFDPPNISRIMKIYEKNFLTFEDN